ncbi:MAG TPA: PepSY domain-containing protein [Geminicoccaceae bacterium]|nr:PepSY domain-containing protein [Geminicoccaceae bacterium]
MIRLVPLLPAACLLAASPAFADAPPADAQPLSRVLQTLEQQGDVAYFDEVDWDDDGYWEIEYVDRSGNTVEIRVDPVSGQTRK